jgi:hypothetical protein
VWLVAVRSSLFPLSLLCVCAGCKTTSGPAAHRNQSTTPGTNDSGQAVVETKPRPSRYTNEVKVVRHYPKWNPAWWFGNVDRPTPPDWYRPEDPCRTNRWYWRNSLHNFTHYVIGIYDKPFVRVGRFPDKVFAPEGGWNWAVCKYKFLRLPFLSYSRGGFKFYCGWRERGNFGMKLNF